MEAATATLTGIPIRSSRSWLRLLSDAALVERFRLGDEQAFGTLYRRHQSRVLSICLGVLGSPEDANDAMQEVWADVATGLRSRPPDNFGAWLARVARNSAIDIGRRRRDQPHPDPDELRAGVDQPAEAGTDMSELVAALVLLPERQRSALVLRELGGYSYPEIARTMGLEDRAVSGLIARARISLRSNVDGAALGCETVRERLAAELDGRRRPAEIRRHMRSCQNCRELGTALRGDRKTLRALDPASGFKLLGLMLAGRGGRAALLGGVLVKGTAGGETGKLAALCLAAVCATAGVQEVRTSLPADRGTSSASAAALERDGAGAAHAQATTAASAASPAGAFTDADRPGATADRAAKAEAGREATTTTTADRATPSPTEPASRSDDRPDNSDRGRGRSGGPAGDRRSDGARGRGGERARPLASRSEGGRGPGAQRRQGPSDGAARQPAPAPWSQPQAAAPGSEASSPGSSPRSGGRAAGGDRRGLGGESP